MQEVKEKGFIAISVTLLLLVVIVAIATTVALLSIGEAQSSLALSQGEETLQFVEGCTEDALLKARTNSSYNGGTITRPEGTCSVTISKNSSTWTMTTTTTDTKYKRTIQTVFDRNPTGITLTSWQEIP